MIRTYILAVLKTAASQVQAAFRGTGGNKTSVSEGVEASVIYVRFKAAANEVIHFDVLPMLVQKC
jgi:hypothetical protein